MLTERVDTTVTVLKDGQLAVREETVILRDGVELSRLFHRYVSEPDQEAKDLTNARAKELATALWTPEVKAAYIADKARRTAEIDARLAPATPVTAEDL